MASENRLKVIIGADDQTQAAFKSASQNAAKFAAVMTAALGGTVVVAAKFEKGLAEIQTLLGKGAAPAVAVMRKELLALSAQTGETLGALTKARYDIISAGFTDSAKSADVLNASLTVAKGGLVDAAVAADLMTTALNGMGLESSEAANVADDLFTIVQLGKTTMSELAANMGQVFATANIAGVSLQEVGAAMASITAAGINTAEASTALTQLLAALAAPSGEAKDALDELGISLKDGLGPALQALAGASEEGLDQLKLLIPNIRAVKAAAAAGSDMEKFNANLAAFATNAGVAAEAATIMSDTFTEHFNRLKATVIVFAESVGVELLPQMKTMVELTTKAVSSFGKLPEPVKKVGLAATVAATGVTALAAAFGMLAFNVNNAIVGLGRLKAIGWVANVSKMLGAIGGAAGAGLAAGLGAGAVAYDSARGITGGQRLSGNYRPDPNNPQIGQRIPLPGPAIPANLMAHFNAPSAGRPVANRTSPAGSAGEGITGTLSAMGTVVTAQADQWEKIHFNTKLIAEEDVPNMAAAAFGMSDHILAFAQDLAAFGLQDTVYAFSDALGLAIVAGEDFGATFSRIFKQVKVQLVSAIIEFIALKVVIKGLFAAMGLGGIGSILGFATGTGSVPGPRLAAAGFASVPGGGGLDNVPVLLRGGETVLTPERSDMMRRALYQPSQGNGSLIGRWMQRQQGAGGMIVGVKDSFTGSEAVDFEDILDRANERSEGLR